MLLSCALNCHFCNTFVFELSFVMRFLQYAHNLTKNILCVIGHGQRYPRFLRKCQLKCCDVFAVVFVNRFFWSCSLYNIIITINRLVRLSMIIVTRFAIYFLLYDLGMQYISCDNVLAYNGKLVKFES